MERTPDGNWGGGGENYIISHTRTRVLLLSSATGVPKPPVLSALKPLNAATSVRHVSRTLPDDEPRELEPPAPLISSASAVASAIQKASTSPVEFNQAIEDDHKHKLVLPSTNFHKHKLVVM